MNKSIPKRPLTATSVSGSIYSWGAITFTMEGQIRPSKVTCELLTSTKTEIGKEEQHVGQILGSGKGKVSRGLEKGLGIPFVAKISDDQLRSVSSLGLKYAVRTTSRYLRSRLLAKTSVAG